MEFEQAMKTLVYSVIALAVVLNVGRFVILEIRTHRNRSAPLETLRAVAYRKHDDGAPVMAGRTTNYVYHITFHTAGGEALKLYMDRNAYFRIPEGASGELMFQGEKLWRFTLEDGTEIRQ